MIKIANREVGPLARPYLMAEMSGNHNQSLSRALAIVDAAAGAGADAIKLQTYTADTMTLDVDAPGFTINDPKSLWNGRRLYDLYAEAHTPWEWHKPIMDRATSLGLNCFSTPFDETAVEFLEKLQVSAYKIASFELTDIPLIECVAATGKPLIMSTGMASLAEIDEAVSAAKGAGNDQIVLLKCTSTYPATPENSNISTIPHLRATFGCDVGLSDHTMGCGVAVAAVALGAVLVEKHFTISRSDGGVDSAFSLEPREFAMLREETERAWQGVGNVTYGGTEAERASRAFRRSIYIAHNVARGEKFTLENIRVVRPGYGLPPKFLSQVLGRRSARDATAGTPVSWDLLL